MIVIEELKSVNIPGSTSLFLKLSVYNRTIFDTLIQSPDCYYDSDSGVFEFAVNKLYFLVSNLVYYDYVEFKPLIEPKKELIDCYDYKFKYKPYKYQYDGINYGLNEDKWMLLDEQGLGKTLQMIYLAEVLHSRGEIQHCFIVCCVNSLKFNWESEIKKFSNLTCKILGSYKTKRGKTRISSVDDRLEELKNGLDEFFVITNIETLQHKKFSNYFNKSKSKFDMIVVDEAHRCKDPNSKSMKTLLKMRADKKIALSGTIIMNTPDNAYAPLKWIDKVSCTYKEFKDMYNVYGGYGSVQSIGYKNLDILQNLISTCSLRRLKNEVLDLPEKVESIEYVELGSKQRALYDKIYDGMASDLDLIKSNKCTIEQELTICLRLRQATAFPGILTSEEIPSAKLDRLEELVEDIVSQGDKVIVFNNFVESAIECSRRLEKYNPVCCAGDISDEQINWNKEVFNKDSNCKVMVATWQKMGTGHTLTSANYVIFVDTPWTRADFDQASDRIHRVGQGKTCFIKTLIAKDTYDERVQEILETKKGLSGYIIDNVESDSFNRF